MYNLCYRFVAVDTAQSFGLHKVNVERLYHATSHAKGRQDGFGGMFCIYRGGYSLSSAR